MTNVATETSRVARRYDTFAARYDASMRVFERVFVGDGRRWACSMARGDVLEIALGTGRNVPYYPPNVRLTGIELSPAMLAIARERAQMLGRDGDFRKGDAQALEFEDNRFDTVVCTLALCTIPHERRALAEVVRVLRPGGRFVALEHVGSRQPLVKLAQHVLNPLTTRLMADHLLRDPALRAREAGLVIDLHERSRWGIMERLTARKPDKDNRNLARG